jgi:phage terminase small subunit
MDDRFAPPKHLSERARQLWLELVPSRCRSIGRLTLLCSALESLDRADTAREAIGPAGLTTTTKTTGAVHVHPLVKVERESRQQFARIWCDLGLGFDNCVDGVPFEYWQKQQEAEE